MARFARDRRLVEAIIEGVDAMLHTTETSYDSHDLINWLNANRPLQLNDLYDLYHDCIDPEMTADQQIAIFLNTLGQIKIGEQVSARQIDRRGGGNRNGTCTASVWEISEQAREGLITAGGAPFGPGGFFDRIEAESPPVAAPGWLARTVGMFRDDPVFAEMVRLGREIREADRPDEEP